MNLMYYFTVPNASFTIEYNSKDEVKRKERGQTIYQYLYLRADKLRKEWIDEGKLIGQPFRKDREIVSIMKVEEIDGNLIRTEITK